MSRPAVVRSEGSLEPSAADRSSAQQVIEGVGARMRSTREELGLSLRDIADATGLSVSMVSMVERGKASPSVGTMVAIGDSLGLSMAELFSTGPAAARRVIRRDDQATKATVEGMTRRVVVSDSTLGLEVSEHEYMPLGRSGSVPVHHSGYEVGLVIVGSLCVEIEDEKHQLRAGDAVRFPSSLPHRFENLSRNRTRAVWINLTRWSTARLLE